MYLWVYESKFVLHLISLFERTRNDNETLLKPIEIPKIIKMVMNNSIINRIETQKISLTRPRWNPESTWQVDPELPG